MKSLDSKHFCCPECHRSFTRIDHLKRHELRHTGHKPYTCRFCNVAFTRCDNLRDHYSDCAARGERKIPETGQRGRRRHACQSCTAMKLRCDGMSPCGSCKKRHTPCNNERRYSAEELAEGMEGAPPKRDDEPPSNRGSIQFLLNGGTDEFTKNFLLPPRTDRICGLEYQKQKDREDVNNALLVDQIGYPPAASLGDGDITAAGFYADTFLDFFQSPFGDPNKVMGDPYPDGMSFPPVVPQSQAMDVPFATQPAAFEPERPFAANLANAIATRALIVPLDAASQQELAQMLNILLTTSNIRKFVGLYFKYWQPNCAMLHYGSFDPETVSLHLLAAVSFMGAMYSSDAQEEWGAKRLLDFAELFVFSSDVYSCESEVAAAFNSTGASAIDDPNDMARFQDFQAGFIMCIVQYWSGNPMSRNRAMENRFSEVIKVARRMKLPQCRHQPEDGRSEELWIQKECRIRTMSIILLLDCAFSFFQNYPCRLSHTEIACDFPSPEHIFFSDHPFHERDFRIARSAAMNEVFRNLFKNERSDASSATMLADVTVLDMFILIHLLYTFINSHMTHLAPLIRETSIPHPRAMLHDTRRVPGNRSNSNNTNAHTHKPRSPSLPEDATLAAIRTALTRWRDHWFSLKDSVSKDEWGAMGFYKNGYNFWLVSQLLITKKESVDELMRMEVKCEDKLEKLKVLLKDDSS